MEDRGLNPQTLLDPDNDHLLRRADFAWDTIMATGTQSGEKYEVVGHGIQQRDRLGYGWHNMEPVTAGEVSRGIHEPPATRATDRIKIVQAIIEMPGAEVDSVDWGKINFTTSEHGPVEEVSMPDPYGGNPGLDI